MYLMYLRKSRADDTSMTVQEVLERHETMLQEYCKEHFGAELEERYIYREVFSGETIADRPQMQKVLECITNNDVDGVLVVEPQRLSRGDLVDCGTICRVFKYSNTKIITPKWTYDLTDDRDYKFFESELRQGNDFLNYIVGIMIRGRMASAKSGQYIGQSPPYGYDKVVIDDKKTLRPNDKAEAVKYMYDMALKGYTPGAIGRDLDKQGIKPTNSDEWSQKSVYKILKNINYTGKIKYQERKTVKKVDAAGNIVKKRENAEPQIYDGLHPAIIDEDTFNKVQELLQKNTRKPIKTKFASPFASLVKCGVCGYAMTLQTYGGNKKARFACRKKCGNRSISYDDFVDEVIQGLKKAITDFEIEIEPNTNEPQNSLKTTITAELLANEKRLQKIFYAYENGVYSDDDFLEQKAKNEAERKRLEKSLEHIKLAENKKELFEAYKVRVHDAIDMLADDTIPAQDKNIFLKSILKKIEYIRLGEVPEIHLYF